MSEHTNWLPPLVLLEEYEGVWDSYCEALYAIFKGDFVSSQPSYCGMPVAIRYLPPYKGKEGLFWHLTHEGNVEEERLPDLRRCERIRWPRAIIAIAPDNGLRVWQSKRKGSKFTVVAIRDFSYVVVLSVQKERVILWTAYCVERDHRKRKLQAECEAYWQQWAGQ